MRVVKRSSRTSSNPYCFVQKRKKARRRGEGREGKGHYSSFLSCLCLYCLHSTTTIAGTCSTSVVELRFSNTKEVDFFAFKIAALVEGVNMGEIPVEFCHLLHFGPFCYGEEHVPPHFLVQRRRHAFDFATNSRESRVRPTIVLFDSWYTQA